MLEPIKTGVRPGELVLIISRANSGKSLVANPQNQQKDKNA